MLLCSSFHSSLCTVRYRGAEVVEQERDGDHRDDDTAHARRRREDRVELGPPIVDQTFAVLPLDQAEQARDDAKDNPQPQDNVDVLQNNLQPSAEKREPVGSNNEGQDHHQPS